MPIDKTPWTDDTVMPWGEHKGTRLEDVPASYLLWLYEQSWCEPKWPGLYAYLQENEDTLLEQKQDEEPDDEAHEDGYTSYEDWRRDFHGF